MDLKSVTTLRELMQQAKEAGVLGTLVHEVQGDEEGFEVVGQAMTDASKRRLEGYPDEGRSSRQLPVPVVPLTKALAKPKSRPFTTAEMTSQIDLPEGIPTFDHWGKCVIDFGKYGGLDMTYGALMDLTQRCSRAKNYVDWVRTHTNANSTPLLKDLYYYIIRYQQENNLSTSGTPYPGSSIVRRFQD